MIRRKRAFAIDAYILGAKDIVRTNDRDSDTYPEGASVVQSAGVAVVTGVGIRRVQTADNRITGIISAKVTVIAV